VTDEEIRAREWRDARRHRVDYEAGRAALLAGSPERLKQLRKDWEPILSREDCDDDQERQQVE
jgi:hypothetical protein